MRTLVKSRNGGDLHILRRGRTRTARPYTNPRLLSRHTMTTTLAHACSSNALPLTGELQWLVPHSPKSLAALRQTARAALQSRTVNADTVDSVVLIISELVTNSLIHAQAPTVVRIGVPAGESIRIEVSDGGPLATSRHLDNRSPGECGRGNMIVEALASRSGVMTFDDGGVMRWAEVPLP
ncbi:ATP-binding protein [Streptomyces sp. NPDC086777]|uniref:ATP-binding protein n=1 Tax=Streptomyces sp. NPDC086777 TaxID=3154866 RepID=UPI00344C3F26